MASDACSHLPNAGGSGTRSKCATTVVGSCLTGAAVNLWKQTVNSVALYFGDNGELGLDHRPPPGNVALGDLMHDVIYTLLTIAAGVAIGILFLFVLGLE